MSTDAATGADDFEAQVRQEAKAAIADALPASVTNGADAPPAEDGESEAVADDGLDTARQIAEDEGITRMDFMEFQAELTGRGWSRDDAQDAWHTLRDQGVINGDGDTGDGDTKRAGGEDTAQATHRGPQAEEEPPDSVDELEDRVRAADAVYLIVQPGCPTCGQAKEALSEWIDDGMVEVHDIQESDTAVDIAMEKELVEMPALIVEDDGEFRII